MTTVTEYPFDRTPSIATLFPISTSRGFEEGRTVQPKSLIVEAMVRGTRRSLKRPVAVSLIHEGNTWFAENEELNLFGAGTTPSEAIAEFRQHFEHFIEYYRSLSWGDVIGEGRRLKRLLEELLADAA